MNYKNPRDLVRIDGEGVYFTVTEHRILRKPRDRRVACVVINGNPSVYFTDTGEDIPMEESLRLLRILQHAGH